MKALYWASSFSACCYLDSNKFADKYSKFDCLIAVGVKDELQVNSGTAFSQLEAFRIKNKGWITGYLGYDLKNETENLSSSNFDGLNFPDLYFFAPEIIITIEINKISIISECDAEKVFRDIENFKYESEISAVKNKINIQSRLSKAQYINAVDQIRQHIKYGDIYVSNFCQEFFAENVSINPVSVFRSLQEISPTPFSCFFKQKSNHIICASPERFLAKRGSKIISQPIKGTARRGESDVEDEIIKLELRNNAKELQENVMIVDLVRNDLTRSAKKGSVATDELFGLYSFTQVHQMISTVICKILDDITDVQVLKNSFPMGSMTGAPKIKAMSLMEQFEESRRGAYSGAIGYFSPDGDFDFNVVIRSILYNKSTKYLSFHAGSAITYHANAEQEYNECLLKAKAIFEALSIRDTDQQ